jgi:hypothetical protein
MTSPAVATQPVATQPVATQPVAIRPSTIQAAGCAGHRLGHQHLLGSPLIDLAHLILIPDVLDECIDLGISLLSWRPEAAQRLPGDRLHLPRQKAARSVGRLSNIGRA